MLQFAALVNAVDRGFAVDCHSRFQYPCDRVRQGGESLFRCREQAFEFRDGRLALLALRAKGVEPADGVSASAAGFLLDCRRERASGERLVFRLGLDKGRSLDVERLPGKLNRVLESRVCLLGFFKVPP